MIPCRRARPGARARRKWGRRFVDDWGAALDLADVAVEDVAVLAVRGDRGDRS
jgi:hypothetical protein